LCGSYLYLGGVRFETPFVTFNPEAAFQGIPDFGSECRWQITRNTSIFSPSVSLPTFIYNLVSNSVSTK